MLRVHGLPSTFAAFRTSIDVWFQTVTASALAWPGATARARVATRRRSLPDTGRLADADPRRGMRERCGAAKSLSPWFMTTSKAEVSWRADDPGRGSTLLPCRGCGQRESRPRLRTRHGC